MDYVIPQFSKYLNDINIRVLATTSGVSVCHTLYVTKLVRLPNETTDEPDVISTPCTEEIKDTEHMFYGTAYGAKLTAWRGDEQIGETIPGGANKAQGGPYNLRIPLCDDNGNSRYGKTVHFKLDGRYATNSGILQINGVEQLKLQADD